MMQRCHPGTTLRGQLTPTETVPRPSRSAVAVSARVHPRGGVLGQIGLIVAAWVLYSFARSFSGDDVAEAIRNGRLLLGWDDALGFGWTMELNRWATEHALIAVPFAFEYASLHYVVTPLVIVWLWQRRPQKYRSALTALALMTAVGLAFYVLLPVAPPRLLPDTGWVDTMKAWSHIGWWGGAASAPAGLEHLTDQYAAMPSLHVGWAVWCAWVWRSSGNALVRRFGWVYPASIATAVVLTANHYVLDVVVGALLAGIAVTLVPRLFPDQQRAERSGGVVQLPDLRSAGVRLADVLPAQARSGAEPSSQDVESSVSVSSGSITSWSARGLAAVSASLIFLLTMLSLSSLSLMPRILRRSQQDHDRSATRPTTTDIGR